MIEVDGDSHYAGVGLAKDQRRDAFLTANGYLVLRFTNPDVLANPEGVFGAIAQALARKITPS